MSILKSIEAYASTGKAFTDARMTMLVNIIALYHVGEADKVEHDKTQDYANSALVKAIEVGDLMSVAFTLKKLLPFVPSKARNKDGKIKVSFTKLHRDNFTISLADEAEVCEAVLKALAEAKETQLKTASIAFTELKGLNSFQAGAKKLAENLMTELPAKYPTGKAVLSMLTQRLASGVHDAVSTPATTK